MLFDDPLTITGRRRNVHKIKNVWKTFETQLHTSFVVSRLHSKLLITFNRTDFIIDDFVHYLMVAHYFYYYMYNVHVLTSQVHNPVAI